MTEVAMNENDKDDENDDDHDDDDAFCSKRTQLEASRALGPTLRAPRPPTMKDARGQRPA